tara:strand:- start:1272 stop:1700 length:429 start_codon:yes stop_codon:yes gene_type:complete
MFDFLFGGAKKLSLIRELLEQRMRRSGYDELEYRLEVKRLGNTQLVGSPEGTIVTILETIFKMQKNGMMLGQIITSIENHRQKIGNDQNEFNQILKVAQGANPGECVTQYCSYRIYIEHNSMLNPSEVEDVIMEAMKEIPNW